MNKKTVRTVDIAGKRVLVRVDFNVPLEKGRSVTTPVSEPRCRPSSTCWSMTPDRFFVLTSAGPKEKPTPNTV